MKKHFHTIVILLVALAVRLIAWRILPYRDWLSDEAEYWSAATWLAQGRGFSYFDNWIWTRPPLYVLFLAVHIKIFGITGLWSVRFSQAISSVIAVWLTMQIARRLAPVDHAERAANISGWAMALAYSFATYSYLILSETLFLTLFLAGIWLIIRWAQSDSTRQRMILLIGAGLIFGLATLTRAIMLTWLPFVAVWVVVQSAKYKVQSEEHNQNQKSKIKNQKNANFMRPELIKESRSSRLNNQTANPPAINPEKKGSSAGTLPKDDLARTLVQGKNQKNTTHPEAVEGSRRSRFQFLIPDFRSLIPAIILTISVCVVVLPWTAYATARWGHGAGLIVVDTTGGYNFALGGQSSRPEGRDENELHDELCGGMQCDNRQAERQAKAYALGLQWIRHYPTGFIAKTGRELLDMVQLRFGGAERMTKGYTTGTVPLTHLAGLLMDDTLYVLALGFAIFGLFRSQGRAGKGLILTWLGYNVAVGALVFAINRFRLPLMPFIFVYAACGVVQLGETWASRRRRVWATSVATMLMIIVLLSYLPIPVAEGASRPIWTEVFNTINGRRNAATCSDIETAMRSGDLARARQEHDALDAQFKQAGKKGLDCLALINVQLLELEGKRDEALRLAATYNDNTNPLQSARVLMLEGSIYQHMGKLKEAADRLNFRTVEIMNDLDWAWQHLSVVPTNTLDLGSGFDYGYVRGFYQSEHDSPDFRWSSADAAIRFPQSGTGSDQMLRLHVRGTTMPTIITPHVNGQALAPITLPTEWAWIELNLPATPQNQDVVIEFRSNVFINGPQELAERVRSTTSDPLRLLGFQLDRAELK